MGDVHGNHQALLQCLSKCNFDKSRDTLIQLGDVGDRHSQTREVVDELFGIPSMIAIRGNHDVWIKEWLRTKRVDPFWLRNGGAETMASYGGSNKIDLKSHLIFFNSQLDFHIDKHRRLYVHAGYVHPRGPEFESDVSICYWDRSLWRNSLEALSIAAKPALLEPFSEIFIGHTRTLNWYEDIPMDAFNVWNLDTGAGSVGKLTVMDVAIKEFWQSD